MRLSSSGNEASEGVDEGFRGQGGRKFQMTETSEEAGKDQAVVFLSSFSVDNEEWSNTSTSELANGYGVYVDGNRHRGKASLLVRRFRRESSGIGDNDN